VYANNTGSEFSTSITEASERAVFKGSAASADAYYAIYPASAAVSASGKVITANIPTEQTVNAGGMPKDAALIVAKAEIDGTDSTFYFMNVGALLKFQIAESEVQDISKITAVVIRTADDALLTGKVDITVGEPKAEPSLKFVEGKSYVTLSGSAGDFKADTDYYVAVAPVAIAEGLTVEFYAGSALMASKTSTKSATLSRADCGNMGTVELEDPAYKWTLVTSDVEADCEYAIAYPSGDGQYYIFSFQKYLESAVASESRTDLEGIKLSKLKNKKKKPVLIPFLTFRPRPTSTIFCARMR